MLIDFTDNRRDRDGTVFHAYEYVYNDWSKHVMDLPRRGVLVKAPTGKGVLGEDRTSVDFTGCDSVTLHFVVGNDNAAGSLTFALEDSDGTVHTWSIPLGDKPRGREVRQMLDLSKPDNAEKPGKKPGLNLKKASKWEVKGDWQDAYTEVLFIKLTGLR